MLHYGHSSLIYNSQKLERTQLPLNRGMDTENVVHYTMDKQNEKEVRVATPFSVVTNNIKYLGVTLTKEVKDLYDKNFKSLKKEIKEDLRRRKDLPCSWIGKINI